MLCFCFLHIPSFLHTLWFHFFCVSISKFYAGFFFVIPWWMLPFQLAAMYANPSTPTLCQCCSHVPHALFVLFVLFLLLFVLSFFSMWMHCFLKNTNFWLLIALFCAVPEVFLCFPVTCLNASEPPWSEKHLITHWLWKMWKHFFVVLVSFEAWHICQVL